jgi:hypothetical protein
MKKKIFGGIAVLAIAAVAVVNVNLNSQNNDLSDISLANVEALAVESDVPRVKYSSTKTITKNYYNPDGTLDRTESWSEPCCATGDGTCSGQTC